VYSNSFSYNGGNLSTSGLRVVAERQITEMFTATLDYSFGGVLTLNDEAGPASFSSLRYSLTTKDRHALAAKVSGTAPATKTRYIASYRWTSGDALTPVDMFNATAGQADPYLSLFLRQPIPRMGFLPKNMEALVDVRNLLAQGYVPVVGQDGKTMFLVQSARSVRGGLAFTF
jgi:hypothetical protein